MTVLIAIWLHLVTSVAGAQGFGLGDFVSPGPLAEPHAHLSGITQCTECHKLGVGLDPKLCMECHERVEQQVRTRRGFHRNRGTECASCHPDHLGSNFSLTRLDTDNFSHLTETGFALEGKHRGLECNDCHDPEDWTDVQTQCKDCHDQPHDPQENGRPLAECEDCHNVEGWEVASIAASIFDHTDPRQADFLLEGKHKKVECLDCHVDAVFTPIEHDRCLTCHDDPHRSIQGVCEDCHDTSGWDHVNDFDHDLTGTVLVGVHRQVACESCHTRGIEVRLRNETCSDCHRDPHRGQFAPRVCDDCHSQKLPSFKIDDFDHNATEFPLHGEHTSVACSDCHGEHPRATYLPLPHDDCSSCHEDIHQGRFEPTPCKACHVEEGWQVDDFDHDRTDFPLLGKHVEVDCKECHPNEQWSNIAHESCGDCHTDHPHEDSLTTVCTDCHTPTGWKDIAFAHLIGTGFDLAPQHSDLPCTECHSEAGIFSGEEPECESCHRNTRPPVHYPGACDDCHKAPHWSPASLGDLDHATTGFPLRGTHASLECTDCHGHPESPSGTVHPACISCHASDDVHRSMLGPRCDDCHAETTWIRTRFRHQQTGWPLRGAHRLAACVDCHAVSYPGTPQDCRSCHQREAPLDVPAHQSASFFQCDRCHRPYTWSIVRGGR